MSSRLQYFVWIKPVSGDKETVHDQIGKYQPRRLTDEQYASRYMYRPRRCTLIGRSGRRLTFG
jgi:hypothetical protein